MAENLKENKMGVFNNFGEFNAEDEATRREQVMEDFLASDKTHLLMTDDEQQIPTVKIEKDFCGGTFYSANCPQCGVLKILSKELNSMSAVCDKCYCVFKLEK